jgi:hypothetical protein
MVYEPERGRGVINQRQRNYLIDEAHIEPGSQAERSIRQSIRDNLRNALLDMVILERNLEERDRRQVFDSFDATLYDDEGVDHPGTDNEHEVALSELLAFVYRGVADRRPGFEQLLQYAVPRARHPDAVPFPPEYEVSLTVEQLEPGPSDLEAAIKHVANDQFDAMDDREVRAFLRMLRGCDTVDITALYDEFRYRQAAIDRAIESDEGRELSLREFLATSDSWSEVADTDGK